MKNAGIITEKQKEQLMQLAKELFQKRVISLNNDNLDEVSMAGTMYNGAIELIANALPFMGTKEHECSD